MAAAAEPFGKTAAGETVRRVRISAGRLTAYVLTYGAVVQDLRLAGHEPPLVLGFPDFEPYETHSIYYGAIVGRYANRIAHGRFSIDGERFQATPGARGIHTLHGGPEGIDRRVWQLADHGDDFVTLTLRDRDGEMGFPGNLDIACTYRILPPGTLAIELSATCDRPTLCNLAHHGWFNLDDGGAGDIFRHRLVIDAGAYLPVDATLIPTGQVEPVDGTAFDFRVARTIAAAPGEPQVAYDHNWCLAAARRPLARAAWVQGAASGVEMEVWTTEPGLQFFGGGAPGPDVPGLLGRRYGTNAAICLEPQVWPDSPNHPWFPQAVLRPGEQYRQRSEYRFRSA
ncbi:MAG: galactose mutarotase [Rhizobiaceae bacterium]|nr:galactose mutarotase [Rhizobiaceae bacterium]